MWLPDWLYERLPLAYFLSAGFSLFALEGSFPARLSAMLLGSAALLTWRWRREARQDTAWNETPVVRRSKAHAAIRR